MDISELKGKVLKSIINNGNELLFETLDNIKYKMYRIPDCCESVCLEDVAGDLNDLIGVPIVIARVETNSNSPKNPNYDESHT